MKFGVESKRVVERPAGFAVAAVGCKSADEFTAAITWMPCMLQITAKLNKQRI